MFPLRIPPNGVMSFKSEEPDIFWIDAAEGGSWSFAEA